MQVFKTTLKIVLRNPLYLLLYIVFFGVLGVIITGASSDALTVDPSTNSTSNRLPLAAVIDRDQSTVSQAFSDFLAERSTLVPIEDTPRALQDATALNSASYIIIIPDGFGMAFIDAARTGATLPVLDTVINYAQSDSVYMELVVNEYLSALKTAALGSPGVSAETLLSTTAKAAMLHANTETIVMTEQADPNAITAFFFQWMAYPITNGLIVLTALVFFTFQSGELRRRTLCSPLSPSAVNLQVALGSVSLVLITWVFLILLALLPQCGGMGLIASSPLTFALFALAALVYAFVPFSIGFFLSQIGMKEMAYNGAANIISLTFCFLSGIFMGGTTYLAEGVRVAAHFIPTFWYSEAIASIAQGVSSSTLSVYFGNLGIVALFAIAFFSVALIMGKTRAQSAQAGGNPAAEAVV